MTYRVVNHHTEEIKGFSLVKSSIEYEGKRYRLTGDKKYKVRIKHLAQLLVNLTREKQNDNLT